MARTLSTQQIASLVRQVGFPEEMVPTMTAVTMAESGGNPLAHNPNRSTGDNSYGLLQINMIDGMGPERRAQFGIKSDQDLFDPLTNLRAAKQIYDQQGIGAWGAYTNGSYKKYLGKDSAGGQAVTPGDAGPNAAFVSGGGGALNNSPGGGGGSGIEADWAGIGGNSLPSTGSPEKDAALAGVTSGGLLAGLGIKGVGNGGYTIGAEAGKGQRMAGGGDMSDIFNTAIQTPSDGAMAGSGMEGIKAGAPGTSQFVTGNTGASTGPHLDFRVYSKKAGGYVNNPGDFVHLVTTADGKGVADAFQMTSPYGMRNHPTKGGQRLHEGIDYATPSGTKLNVAGKFVARKSEPGGGGNYSIYAHPTDPDKELVLMHGA